MDEHGIRYDELSTDYTSESMPRLRLRYRIGGSYDLDLHFWFDSDGKSMHYGTSPITHVPQGEIQEALQAINDANRRYRWLSFFLDMNDGDDDCDIIAEGDQIVTPDTVAPMCLELTERMLKICDDIRAEFASTLGKVEWG